MQWAVEEMLSYPEDQSVVPAGRDCASLGMDWTGSRPLIRS